MKRRSAVIISILISLIIGLPVASAAQSPQQQKKLKVFISVDMEGIGGVVSGDFTSQSGHEYERARKWMTEEVNAAIKGALAAGATEILVNDSHGSMRNILIENLNEKAELISGSPKPLSMMQGIDNSFDAVIFIGYHARMGTEGGVLDHTYHGGVVSNIKINGKPRNEAEINAAIAGYYGVPVVMIAGDAAVVSQAKESLGNIEGVVVKEGVGRYAARVLPPAKVRKLIKEAAQRAVTRRNEIKPFKFKYPIKLEIDFLKSSMADMAALVPGVVRTGGRSVSYVGKDYIETFKLMRALISLASKQ